MSIFAFLTGNGNVFVLIFGTILTIIGGIGCFMYIIIMGPTRYHKDGYIGKLYHFLTALPPLLGGACCSLFCCCNQKRGRAAWRRCSNSILRERNVLMIVFYIAVVWTAEYFYLFWSLPMLRAPLWSKALSWGLVLLSELLWFLSCYVDPGYVTARHNMESQKGHFAAAPREEGSSRAKAAPASRRPGGKQPHRGASPTAKRAAAKDAGHDDHHHDKNAFTLTPELEYVVNRRYVVDGVVSALMDDGTLKDACSREELDYVSPISHLKVGFGPVCTTCMVPRPARSRHCRICDRCVRRYDHHCPWINNDVAEGNHRYFVSFLFCHAISCTWSTYDSYRAIKQFMVDAGAWGWTLKRGGTSYPLSVFDYMSIIISYLMCPACLIFFTTLIGIVLYCFWIYQMSFVVKNLTMNETIKMEDAARFVSDLPSLDLVYREAKKVRERLDEVAARKPKALLKLQEPPLPMTAKGFEEGGKKNKKYRKEVRKMVLADLKGLYDRGVKQNMLEVFFPYRIVEKEQLDAVSKYV
ncbi:Zinc finger DHHC domain containing transmembrane protein [Strigomonas culicis]|uniref:Palmitoyltransferase n=1 Tax=Strigomonas culicis TaxID=28005 RepID=S9UIF8_9TRYP|nr:Zinc finger DHHC domain containing transmembrane protein [Strigomonas culicis]|eukprot:EPY28733.1 Zinc finger DHHC domain containing transmembrane protein [Strigomonas culicis]